MYSPPPPFLIPFFRFVKFLYAGISLKVISQNEKVHQHFKSGVLLGYFENIHLNTTHYIKLHFELK